MTRSTTGGYASDPDSAHRRVRYERDEGEPASVAVAIALARFRGEDVTDTSTRLYDYVDPEALDCLFADRHDGERRAGGQVRFEVDGLAVVVRSTSVRVYPDV